MDFTIEEINLCKQVAEKHRKKLTHGDWFYDEKSKTVHLFQRNKTRVERKILTLIYPTGELPDIRCFHWFPLWTISDCLEFLREEGFTIIQACEHPMSNEWIVEVNPYFSNAVKIMGHKSFDVRGDTLLIACLKAVLVVLEEK